MILSTVALARGVTRADHARSMPGQTRSLSRRAAILTAALACYDELGWTATTIADIRARSGASTGSIYHHFGDKEGIAAALYAEALHRYRGSLRVRVDRARSAKGFVRAIVLHHVEWAVENQTLARYLLEMRGSEGVRRAEADVRASTKAFLEEIYDRLRRWVDAGEIVSVPPALYVSLILGPAQDVVRHWIRGRIEVDLRALAKPLADAAWRSIRAEAP
jgi:AcrR family transcriptional regulator